MLTDKQIKIKRVCIRKIHEFEIKDTVYAIKYF